MYVFLSGFLIFVTDSPVRLVHARGGVRPSGGMKAPHQKPFYCNMNKFFVKVLVCIGVFAAAFSVDSYAQRQTAGRSSMELYGSGITGWGGGFAWSNYGFNGRTYFGIDVFSKRLGYYTPDIYNQDGELIEPRHTDFIVPSYEVLATMGYLWRIASNRSRSFIFSGGIGIGAGVRYSPVLHGQHPYDNNGKGELTTYYPSIGFLFSVTPELQMEMFPANNVSAFVSLRPRVFPWDTLGKLWTSWFSPQVCLGLKYYL